MVVFGVVAALILAVSVIAIRATTTGAGPDPGLAWQIGAFDSVEMLPTDRFEYHDTELVAALIAASIERTGATFGLSCDADHVDLGDEPTPFVPVARLHDGECVVGGYVSRAYSFPQYFPAESRTEVGWQPDYDSMPIFDDQGVVVGDMFGETRYFVEHRTDG